MEKVLADSKGYAVFSNMGVNLFLVSTQRGGGILRDNRNNDDIYMKMFSAGGGDLAPLGEANGYQHLYLEATGSTDGGNAKMTWLGPGGFYTLTSVAEQADQLLLARSGANDPSFNLRRDPAFILRRRDTGSTLFATVVESHGSYSPVTELALDSRSLVASVEVVHDDAAYTAVAVSHVDGGTSIFVVSNKNPSPSDAHQLVINGNTYSWSGPYHYFDQHSG